MPRKKSARSSGSKSALWLGVHEARRLWLLNPGGKVATERPVFAQGATISEGSSACSIIAAHVCIAVSVVLGAIHLGGQR